MAYRAEIEIGVRGTRQLEELRSKINQSAIAADSLNETLGKQGRLAQSLGNYERLLGKAARTLKNVIAGTEGETKAIKEYVTILGQANEAQARQNGLIEREIALRNRLKDAGPRTALRAQERGIFVEETISRGRSARIARERSAYLQGPGRTADAERLAQLAAQESEERQKAFKARESYAKEIFNIERNFNKQIRENEVDNIMKTFKLEEDIQTRLFNKALELDKKEGEAFDAELKRRTAAKEAAFEKERRIAEQVAKSSPIGGAENIPGSPAFLRARARRRREATGSAIIGGAFPLLFGQGIGAAAGGALGGGLGGAVGGQFGFGLSLVGTALGQVIDTTVQKAKELGQALSPLTADIDTIVESLGVTGQASANLIKRLEEVADKQVALEAATAQLALVVGNDGVNALQSFGEATTELNNAITKLVTQILAEVARLLDAPTRAAAGVVEEFTLQQQGLRSSDPRQVLLRTQLSNAAGPQQSQEILQQIIQLQKQINAEAEKELENRVNALSPTKDLLASEERRNAIARLNNDILNDEVLNLEKANVAAEYRIEKEKIQKDLTEKKLTNQEATNRLKANELAYDTALLSIMKKRVDAEEQRNKKIREAAERAAKEAARAQEQRTKQLETATVNAYKSENALLDVRLATLEFEKGAVAAAKQKLTNIALERDNAIAILEIQYKEVAAKAKSNEEALTLYTTYLNQRAVLKEQAELEYDRTQEKIKQLQAAERLAAIERRTGVAFGALLNESGMFAEDPLLGRAESPLAFGTGAQMQGLINQELALERIIEKYTQIGEAASLASELVTFGIRDMVSGTRSAEEVFAEFLQNIADMLLRTAATMIAQYIALGIARAFALGQTARVGPEMFNLGNTSFFGNAPALGGLGFGGGGPNISAVSQYSGIGANTAISGLRANGGPVSAGQSYIVGERGPELFVPKGSGTIVPNDRLGGGDNVSVVVNVDAKGTSVQGNDQEGNQLGRALSAAVKAELIKQKRPGGLLA